MTHSREGDEDGWEGNGEDSAPAQRMRPRSRGTVGWALGLLALACWVGTASAQTQSSQPDTLDVANAACLACHGRRGAAIEIDGARFRVSAHGRSLTCQSCHLDVHSGIPTDPAAATLLPGETCGQCHESVYPSHVQPSIGRAVCTLCHSVHTDPPIAEAGPTMSERCGRCHPQARAEYDAGGHAAGLAEEEPNSDLPNCLTCHADHAAPGESLREVRLFATTRCMECHSRELLISKYGLPEEVSDSYARDFHGETLQFLWRHPAGEDQPEVLVCSDCHGAHEVGWLGAENVAVVCLRCHEDADEKFAGAWLGHDPLGPQNRVAVWAVRIFYYLFVPLVLGGLLLNILFHFRKQRQERARLLESDGINGVRKSLTGTKATQPIVVTRFNALERIEHLAAMILFTLLILTGLPQTIPMSGVGNWLVQLWGGIGATRTIHRAVGFLFVAVLIIHVGRGVAGAIRHRRLPQIAMRKRDFGNAWQTLRHYVRGSPRPKVGKFDFREKFEYWGLLLGSTIMTVTGFMLVFPEGASRILPGELLAAARVVHGLEATFAVLVIIVWHSYAVIFRPEIFPLDTSMFTGKITLERLREEHALEYERLFPDGAEPKPDTTDRLPEEIDEPVEPPAPTADAVEVQKRDTARPGGPSPPGPDLPE